MSSDIARDPVRPARSLGGPVACSLAALIAFVGGCATPLPSSTGERALRRSIVDSITREMREPTRSPQPRISQRESGLSDYPDDIRRDIEKRLPELQRMAGPDAYNYDPAELPLGPDLQGGTPDLVAVSLEDVLQLAVVNNLELQFARLTPAIGEAQLVQAEAAFDWVFFANTQWTITDQQIPDRSSSGFGVTGDFRQANDITASTGLRRTLTSGGQLLIQHDLTHSEQTERGLEISPNPSESGSLLVQLDQPLLRNFGSNIAQAQVRIAQNTERDSIAEFKSELIGTVLETEREYWNLVRAHRDLLILQRLLERGEELAAQVYARRRVDATPAQLFEAQSRVTARRSNVTAAQNALRRASDRLKVLINDPDLPLSDETILLPVDAAIDAPIEYSLIDAISTAVENRPEVERSILAIDNATIRQEAADNARLPQLDLRLQARLSALEDDIRDSYATLADRAFIDTLVGVFFEIPIGNREAEAQYRQRTLERQQAAISLRNTVQQIVLELRNSLDNALTNYELIAQRRIARIAAAESLRALIAEKETTGGFTIERLEIEFGRQETLAQSERDEVRALTDYNVSIAELHAALGTTLERNRIEFVVPDDDEP